MVQYIETHQCNALHKKKFEERVPEGIKPLRGSCLSRGLFGLQVSLAEFLAKKIFLEDSCRCDSKYSSGIVLPYVRKNVLSASILEARILDFSKHSVQGMYVIGLCS